MEKGPEEGKKAVPLSKSMGHTYADGVCRKE